MATTFKVVEFYRNNSSSILNTSLDSSSLSTNGVNILNTTNNSDTSTRNPVIVKSPTTNGALESTPSIGASELSSAIAKSANNSSSNLLYNSLGFNVLGGYLTNMPATIVDISSSLNSKLVKVRLLIYFHLI